MLPPSIPLMQTESLEMFDDVAFPDDDEDLDRVLARPAVQAAVEYCRAAVLGLIDLPATGSAEFAQLLDGAEMLLPPSSEV